MKHRYLFGLLIALVGICLYLFQIIYNEVKDKTIADLNSRQLIHAKQAGRGIEEYFIDLITFLSKVAESEHVIFLDDQGRNELDFALKTSRQEIKAITRVDETGRILYTLPYDRTAIGKDITYQKHIREIMKTRKPVVSDVFTAVQGYNAVGLHVPVFKGNEYQGTLAFLIDFQAISRRFLEDIRIGETGYAWMTSREGVELYCPVPGHTGKSVFDNCKDFPSIISMAKEMVKGRQGVTTYTFDQTRERKTENIRKQAVYLPVKVGDTFWAIVVESSEDESLASLESFRNKLVFVIGLLLLGSAVFSFYGMRARVIIREEAKRQKTEKALRESEERYRDLVENATDLICTHDLKGTLLSVNAAAAKDTGFAAEEIVGLRLPDIMPQDIRDGFNNYIEAIQRDGTAAGIMKIMNRKGEVRFWEYRNTLRTEGVPEPLVRGIARDVTEKVLAKRALKESEELFRSYLENAPDGIYMNDLEGNFLYGNRKCEEIIGYRREEMIGKTFLELNLLSEKSLIKAVRLLQANIEGRSTGPDEFELITKKGDIIPVEINTSIIQRMGQKIVLSSVRDITKRKKMEEEIMKADKLESVGILAGGIAHDFNNILTSISGNISLARMHHKPGSKEFDLLSAAETAAIRASGLTRQLLTFAKGGQPVKETASMQQLIRESSLFVLQGSKSACEFQIAEDLWHVDADEGQISQVISNIVINANQAMPEGGIVRITAENLMPEKIYELHVNPGRYIRISISDNGAGIAENHLSKIFDPYFTTKKEGSGLGLAAAYSIIKKHNGQISVDSLPGAGTTFHIYLPASDRSVPIKEEAGLITGSGRVLVMDDDRVLREMAEDMLEILGYKSECAEDGAEAIEMYRKAMGSEKPYDAVILDLSIPGGMGGEEAIKILLEIDPEVNAIVFSGYSESPVLSNYSEYGFKGMMAKPFELKTLGKVLNEVLKA